MKNWYVVYSGQQVNQRLVLRNALLLSSFTVECDIQYDTLHTHPIVRFTGKNVVHPFAVNGVQKNVDNIWY